MDIAILERSHISEVVAMVNELLPSGPLPSFYWPENLLRSELWDSMGYVAFENEKIVGVLAYRSLSFQAFEISLIATHIDHQKRKIAIQLLNHLKNQCDPHRAIWLEVHPENQAALELYQKVGFQVVGKRPKYYRDGASALLMSWTFLPQPK